MTSAQIEFLHDIDAAASKNLGQAVVALREGRPIVLLDDSSRENEGDLIIAAEKITPESMNFLIKQGSGVVCLAMPRDRLDYLGMPMMIPDNTNFFKTAFTVSIEAKTGVTTGVSAKDRAHTISVAMKDGVTAQDFARPGHVFPLAAKLGGVFERMGHTEGSVDLMKIAKLKAGAVLCELMNADGTMTIGEDLVNFAKKFNIPVVTVDDILFHRIKTENIAEKLHSKQILSHFGEIIWQRWSLFSAITVDVFHNRSFTPSSTANTRLSLSVDENTVNRLIAQVLNHTCDDSLVMSLKKLQNNESDVAMLVTHNFTQRDAQEKRKNIYASICRVITSLQLNNIQFSESNDELSNIAQKHFDIQVNN